MDFTEHLYYDESSPSCLRWKHDRYCGKGMNVKQISAGDVAGHFHSTGYYIVGIGYARHRAHRIVFNLHNPDVDISGVFVDHRDCDSSNNKVGNLRAVTQKINMRNTKKSKRNSSGLCGVNQSQKNGGLWYYNAEILCHDGTRIRKSFSMHKYGILPAFAMACKFREDTIRQQNLLGAGYTDNHGK